ncbi:MAG: cbb3-type cytochrome oxidase assembly protein CcoS [Burkholderiales bacterium]
MDILYLLIPLSVVLVFLIGAVFWWALRSGQFDDLEGPALKVLLDDDSPPKEINDADGSNAISQRPDVFDLRQRDNSHGR